MSVDFYSALIQTILTYYGKAHQLLITPAQAHYGHEQRKRKLMDLNCIVTSTKKVQL